jgi:hypothetical protein
MGIAVVGLIAGLSQSVRNAARLTDYDRAAMQARTKMNDLLLDPALPFEGRVQGAFDETHGWQAELRPYDAPPNAGPGTKILQQIALEIWWQPESGPRRTLDLAGYRPIEIPTPPAPQ